MTIKSFKSLFLVVLATALMSSLAFAQPINFTSQLVTNWFAAHPFPVDMDEDGDMDIFVVSHQNILWCENNGFMGFTHHEIHPFWDYGLGGWAGDVDGDGDVDVAAAAWTGDEVAWWENDGEENFTYHSLGLIDGAADIDGVDLDDDGDIDFIGQSDNGYFIYWMEQDPIGTFTQHLVASVRYPRVVEPVDFDGDGDWDIVYESGSACARNDSVGWLENDGSENFTKHWVGYYLPIPSEVHGVDLDQDGDMDIIAGSYYGDLIVWYENDGSNLTFTEHIITTMDAPKNHALADLDEDGDLDIVSGSMFGDYFCWFENDGSQYFTQHIIPGWMDYPGRVEIADMDLDGDLDFTASIYQDYFYWYESDLDVLYHITLELIPSNPPVQVPAGGGSFNSALNIVNTSPDPYVINVYFDVTLPNGSIYPLFSRDGMTLSAGGSIMRLLGQYIPGNAMPGHYSYNAHVRDHAIWYVYAEDSFDFEKLEGLDAPNHNRGWEVVGFDEEITASAYQHPFDPEARLCFTPPIAKEVKLAASDLEAIQGFACAGFEANSVQLPTECALFSAYPNPFNPETIISFELRDASFVELAVYDITGREIARLVDEWHSAGTYEATFDGSGLSSGVYFARLTAGDIRQSRKLLLIK